MRGRINCETDKYRLPYRKQITNKDLLYSTGNSTQYLVMAYKEVNLEETDALPESTCGPHLA